MTIYIPIDILDKYPDIFDYIWFPIYLFRVKGIIVNIMYGLLNVLSFITYQWICLWTANNKLDVGLNTFRYTRNVPTETDYSDRMKRRNGYRLCEEMITIFYFTLTVSRFSLSSGKYMTALGYLKQISICLIIHSYNILVMLSWNI